MSYNFLHQLCASLYGVELADKRKEEPRLRSVEEKLIYLNKLGYEHVLDKKQIVPEILYLCDEVIAGYTASIKYNVKRIMISHFHLHENSPDRLL